MNSSHGTLAKLLASISRKWMRGTTGTANLPHSTLTEPSRPRLSATLSHQFDCSTSGIAEATTSASSTPTSGSRTKSDVDDDLRNPNSRDGLHQPQLFFKGLVSPSATLHGQVLRRQHLNVGYTTSGRQLLLQQQGYGISTSAQFNAGEGEGTEEPVRSPLSQAPGPLGSGGQRLGISPTKTAEAVLTGIRMSPQKLNLVAEMVRGMRVEDALTQMAVSVKRAAKTVSKVVHSAQANAVHNFGLEKDRLVVSEAFVGKDRYLKRMRPHGKGKAGKMEHARARLTVVVKEMSAEQETDLARLRLFRSRGTRMTRSEARLVPHRVLATQWSRQRPPAASKGGQSATSSRRKDRGALHLATSTMVGQF